MDVTQSVDLLYLENLRNLLRFTAQDSTQCSREEEKRCLNIRGRKRERDTQRERERVGERERQREKEIERETQTQTGRDRQKPKAFS